MMRSPITEVDADLLGGRSSCGSRELLSDCWEAAGSCEEPGPKADADALGLRRGIADLAVSDTAYGVYPTGCCAVPAEKSETKGKLVWW